MQKQLDNCLALGCGHQRYLVPYLNDYKLPGDFVVQGVFIHGLEFVILTLGHLVLSGDFLDTVKLLVHHVIDVRPCSVSFAIHGV